MVLPLTAQQVVLSLLKGGASALEIAEQLGFSFHEVYDFILEHLTKVPASSSAMQRKVQPRSDSLQSFAFDNLLQLFEALTRSACDYGHLRTLWTVPGLIATARSQYGIHISKRTLRRYQKKLGLTFEDQLARYTLTDRARDRIQVLRSQHPRSLIFLVISVPLKQHFEETIPPSTMLLGLSATGRIAATVRSQSRVSTSFKAVFLQDLLQSHPTHHLIVLTHEVGLAQRRLLALEQAERQLHFIWCTLRSTRSITRVVLHNSS